MSRYILTAYRMELKMKNDIKKLAKELTVSQSAIVRIALRAFIKKHRSK